MAAISLFWDTNMATVTSCAWLIVQVARNDVLFTFFSLLFVQDCSFSKLRTDTALKVSFQGIMRVAGTGQRCNRWYIKLNGRECNSPVPTEAVLFNSWPSSVGNPNVLHHRSFEGYCENITRGAVRVELWIGKCKGFTLGDAATGWTYSSRIIVEEVSRPQL